MSYKQTIGPCTDQKHIEAAEMLRKVKKRVDTIKAELNMPLSYKDLMVNDSAEYLLLYKYRDDQLAKHHAQTSNILRNMMKKTS